MTTAKKKRTSRQNFERYALNNGMPTMRYQEMTRDGPRRTNYTVEKTETAWRSWHEARLKRNA